MSGLWGGRGGIDKFYKADWLLYRDRVHSTQARVVCEGTAA